MYWNCTGENGRGVTFIINLAVLFVPTGFAPSHTSTTKYNFDRGTVAVNASVNVNGNGGGHVDYNDRGSSGGESSSSSTAGLDVSYRYGATCVLALQFQTTVGI